MIWKRLRFLSKDTVLKEQAPTATPTSTEPTTMAYPILPASEVRVLSDLRFTDLSYLKTYVIREYIGGPTLSVYENVAVFIDETMLRIQTNDRFTGFISIPLLAMKNEVRIDGETLIFYVMTQKQQQIRLLYAQDASIRA